MDKRCPQTQPKERVYYVKMGFNVLHHRDHCGAAGIHGNRGRRHWKIARVLFFLFLIVFLVTLLMGLFAGKKLP